MVGLKQCEWIEENEEGEEERCPKMYPESPKPVLDKYDGQHLCGEHKVEFHRNKEEKDRS